MNTHDIDIELPPLPKASKMYDIPGYDEEELKDYARAAIEADRKRRFESGEALQRYKDCEGDKESDPIERLRFYCSLAMSGQDWLDVEPFFDDLIADRKRRGEPVKVNAIFETQDGEVIGTTDAKVERVEWQDDGSLTVVIDYWPQPAEPNGYVGVSLRDIKVWRNEWLEDNDPEDGTDCVTPFDKYLYASQPADEELRRDAARYRWLRDPCSGAERVIFYCRGDYGRGLMSGSMLDAAIDEAMEGEKGQ